MTRPIMPSKISSVEFERHQCMIYQGSPVAFLPDIAAVTVEKLKARFRCLYLNSPPMVAGLRSYLAAAGVAVADEVRRGALILSSDQSHLIEGRFDADNMLTKLADTLDAALRDGYAGLFATGDMTWEFGSEKNFEKLLNYERGLEQLFRFRPELHGICQYHRDTLPADAVEAALCTHRAAFINQSLSLINPCYGPTEDRSFQADIRPGHLEGLLARNARQEVS